MLGTGACPSDETSVNETTGDDATAGGETTEGPSVSVGVNATDAVDSGTADTTGDTAIDPNEDTTESSTTTEPTEGTTTGTTCGDGVADQGEDCDGEDLAGQNCVLQRFDGGDLACAADCTFDTSACTIIPVCGNDIVDGKEVCDGDDLAGEGCVSQGFEGGVLACLDGCTGYDTTACMCENADIGSVLGHAVASGDTAGDDDDVDASCGGPGGNDHIVAWTAPSGGVFSFDLRGSEYDTKLSLHSACDARSELECNVDDSVDVLQSEIEIELAAGQRVYVVVDGWAGSVGPWVLNIFDVPLGCGDGAATGAEVCDGDDVLGATCASAGLSGGAAVTCTADCASLDITACDAPVGYGNCADFSDVDTCAIDEACVDADDASGVCTDLSCDDATDCPAAPTTGTAPVRCEEILGDGDGDCFLSCQLGETCPDGMHCVAGLACVWGS
ncbi:MAG: hypothetical protein JNK45_23795 [Myxococcales bacterium]|nr:hypothetical protein [Myxococcales bacterium]